MESMMRKLIRGRRPRPARLVTDTGSEVAQNERLPRDGDLEDHAPLTCSVGQ